VPKIGDEPEKFNMKKYLTAAVVIFVAVLYARFATCHAAPAVDKGAAPRRQTSVYTYGATGDGIADDSEAIQHAVDASAGQIRLPKGTFRITVPIVIDLDQVGFTSISGGGVARIVMAGPGPAFRFVGTHAGTAAPRTVRENVWMRQRAPMIDGIEIVGAHPQACGIGAIGTIQLTLTRVVVRDALHGIHLTKRNRNVIISECHLYHNRGIGVFLDRLNLHQINITGSHISYNAGGGVVARQSEIRNLQIGTCDLEANMGGPDSAATANILLDSTDSSIGEVAIVGCTIQHANDAPNSANIRINGRSTPRSYTDELRHGNMTIANNILSDVQTNVEIRNTRAVTITGNTMWKGYAHNLMIDQCANVVVASNVFDRNPRYHRSSDAEVRLGLVFTDSTDCTISGNHIQGTGPIPAAVVLRRCKRMNMTGCTILDYDNGGLLLEDVSDSRFSDCLIRNDRAGAKSVSLQATSGHGNMIVNNLLGSPPKIDANFGVVRGNVQP
jgi:hypothetical protein